MDAGVKGRREEGRKGGRDLRDLRDLKDGSVGMNVVRLQLF